jgi:hypothetical protein
MLLDRALHAQNIAGRNAPQIRTPSSIHTRTSFDCRGQLITLHVVKGNLKRRELLPLHVV